jgi:hypothetical protein
MRHQPRQPTVWVGVLLVLVVVLLLPAAARAVAFPLYHAHTSHRDQPTTETWVVYPFWHRTETTTGTITAIHPVVDWYHDTTTGERGGDVLWPVYTWRHTPRIGRMRNVDRQMLFPLFYNRRATVDDRTIHDRFLIPLWFEGEREREGMYQILFPFYWYAYNARLAFPLFPNRPQTFAALWPLVGDFRGYWNRDRIFFLLWPLFVYSTEGEGADKVETRSFVWPILGLHGGPRVSGGRLWPLFSTVTKEDEFTRTYWLWPLGHYRQGRISRKDPRQEDVLLFIPLYGRIRRPDFDFDLVFPFYGRLKVGQREVDGYALALYNREINHRRGTIERRWGWFIWRQRQFLPGRGETAEDRETTTGGGLFPVYLNVESEKHRNQSIIWPFYRYRWTQYHDNRFTREYLVPLYSSQHWAYPDGTERRRSYVFPFFRSVESREGNRRRNSLHLWFHTEVEAIDRLYAPLWELWWREDDERTGEFSVRWFQSFHAHDRRSDGSEKSATNLLFFDRRTHRDAEGAKSASTRLFWGLAGWHSTPTGNEAELFWMRF